MIKLTKDDKPRILEAQAASWTSQLLTAHESGVEPSDSIKKKYNQEDIKEALRRECHSKCVYCESKMSHVTYEHIEHIKPKSKYPELSFEWGNLTLACPVCNTNKGNTYDESVPFVNPYIDEPDEYLIPLGGFIYYRPGNKRGEITVKKIDLNRSSLIEQRKERIDSIQRLADKYCEETNPTVKQMLSEEIKKEYEPDKPYSACVKSTVEHLLGGN